MSGGRTFTVNDAQMCVLLRAGLGGLAAALAEDGIVVVRYVRSEDDVAMARRDYSVSPPPARPAPHRPAPRGESRARSPSVSRSTFAAPAISRAPTAAPAYRPPPAPAASSRPAPDVVYVVDASPPSSSKSVTLYQISGSRRNKYHLTTKCGALKDKPYDESFRKPAEVVCMVDELCTHKCCRDLLQTSVVDKL